MEYNTLETRSVAALSREHLMLEQERESLRLLEAEALIQQAISLEANGQSLRSWRLLLTLYALDYEHKYDDVKNMPFYELAKSLAAA